MNPRMLTVWRTGMILAVLLSATVQAQRHIATRLGNPATRFAKPLRTEADLRALFRAPGLQEDIAAVLVALRWPGRLADLHQAAAEAPIREIQFPPGTRLPAMSSREDGRPILLRDVLWAGEGPMEAYEFFFTSQGRRYRVVTPKACSNFWVEDEGADLPPPRPALRLVKTAPAEANRCALVPVRLTVQNTGNVPLAQVRVSDPLPDGFEAAGQPRTLTFEAGTLQPGEGREFAFEVTAVGAGAQENVAVAADGEGTRAEARSTTLIRAGVLTLQMHAPAEVPAGRPATVCLTVANTGDGPESQVVVSLAVPAGVRSTRATAGGETSDGQVRWVLGDLAPHSSQDVCAEVTAPEPGLLSFVATAQGACAPAVRSEGQTRLAGIPAILLEVVDLDDPIEVGKLETYVITVTNQGTAPATNLRLSCRLEPTQSFVSGTGATPVTAAERTISMGVLPSLNPQDRAVWQVVVRALEAGDVRFTVELVSDQLTRPVWETEATNQY